MKLLRVGVLFVVSAIAAVSAARAASSPTGAIVFVGTDNNIHYARSASEKPECLTCPHPGTEVRNAGALFPVALASAAEEPRRIDYAWPTFSPDAARIAYSSVSRGPKGESYAVWVYDLARHQATQIYESRTERVVYIRWLPDGKHLSFLLDEPHGLSLMLSEAKEGAPIRIVMTGVPLYFDWASNGDRLVFHTAGADGRGNERVGMLSMSETNQREDKILSSGRIPFKTPCWSPDGTRLAYIANYHAESTIVVADANGEHSRSIVSLPVGDNSLLWSPDSKHIAYATTVVPHDPTFRGIKLVDIDDASSRVVTRDDVAAYFFSPNGRYLAYIAVPEEKPYYIWKIADLKKGEIRDLGRFLSTQEESIAYRFFEQLALSHTIWSNNSDAIVFAGVRLLVEPDRELRQTPPPSVWVMPIDGGEPRQIDAGVLAFYSPAGL